MIRPAEYNDCEEIAEIYNFYIRETVATFEENEVSGAEIWNRVEEVLGANLPWLVAIEGNSVVGYAYASKWKGRCAYRHSVETTVYLDSQCEGKGWGTKLYRELLSLLDSKHIHAVIGGIALPNLASIALHEKFGFEKVAHFKEVGFKFNQWIDVGYWQKTHELHKSMESNG